MAKANTIDDCLTVADLIKQLQKFSPAARVYYEFPAHDHWRTTLASAVESVEEEMVVWSDYHEQFKLAGDDRPNAEHEQFNVVLLKGC